MIKKAVLSLIRHNYPHHEDKLSRDYDTQGNLCSPDSCRQLARNAIKHFDLSSDRQSLTSWLPVQPGLTTRCHYD